MLCAVAFCAASITMAGDVRKHPLADIFVNNHKFGEKNGCSGALNTTGSMTCGHPGHVSEVTWSFVRSTPEGDVYKITRKYPSDSSAPEMATKEVTFSGKLLVVWRDDFQKIILRPTPAD